MTRAGHDLRLLTAACLAWAVLAAALAVHASPAFMALVAAVALVAGLGAARLTGAARVVALAAVVTALMSGTAAARVHLEDRGPVKRFAVERAVAQLEVRVAGEPRRLPDSGLPGQDGTRYLVPAVIERIEARGTRTTVRTPCVLVGERSVRDLAWQQRVRLGARLAPSTRLGPARAVAAVRGDVVVLEEPGRLLRALAGLRSGLRTAAAHLPPDPRGLVPALVVGDTSELPDDLTSDMNATGMSHLNAVSGSNVTVVLIATIWLVGRLGVRRGPRIAAAVVLVLLYVLVCRPEPSVVRAGAMGIAGLLGTSWGRPRAACPALAVAIILLLAWDPWLAVTAGFTLSALATLGLVLFARPWAAALTARLPRGAPPQCAAAAEVCLIPVAAQTLCLPLLVVLNNSVSWVSVPANALAEPLVAPATLAGMLTLLVAAVSPVAASTLVWCAGLPAWGIAGIAHVAARIPGGSVPWPGGFGGAVLALGVVAAALCAWRVLPWLGLRGWSALACCAAAPVACLVPLPGEGAADPHWVYAQCDVGQGDAALVRTGDRRAVLVDAGPSDGALAACLDRHGVAHLDGILLTHFHADHVGGLPAALARAPGAPVLTTWVREQSGEPSSGRDRGWGAARARGGRGEAGGGPQVAGALADAGREATPIGPGQDLTVAGVTITVLGPKRVIHEGSVQNNASLVLDVSAPGLHALMLGDAEREAQRACIEQVRARAAVRAYDVVKVAHHGSSNQDERLYAAAAAPLALIGVGADNDYGHPSPKLLRLLERVGAAAQRTDVSGDLDLVAVGTSLTLEPQR